MVMPRSRSISMESSTCSLPAISRSVRPPVIWIRRSASVDLPWSIWATMAKLRMLEMGTVVMGRGIAFTSPGGNHLAVFQGGFFPPSRFHLSPKRATHGAMSTASILPTAARGKRIPTIRRLGAWLASRAGDPKTEPMAGLWLVTGFAVVHAVLWTLILVNLKTGQDVHMDVAEAYAWGQKFLLGYGKHPPLSGWVAGVWFRLFPVTDWASYALAMATLGCGLVICWLLALRVVDRRRAF